MLGYCTVLKNRDSQILLLDLYFETILSKSCLRLLHFSFFQIPKLIVYLDQGGEKLSSRILKQLVMAMLI
jgi:hypothetical protein